MRKIDFSKLNFLNTWRISHHQEETPNAIDVRNYTKKFKKFVSTDNVSFTVPKGRIHGFIGPNGSGKTTTIKALIGAYRPTKGTLLLNGFRAGTIAANRLIGYIPERASFPPHLNSLDYLVAMGEISGLKRKVAKEKAAHILRDLGLEKQASRKPTTFSSGMQKKILLAQALITDPEVLILDEPAANLDPLARRDLFDQLIRLRNEGKTIFISSHILAELERLVDDITFIYYGELLYSGTASNFHTKEKKIFIKTTDNEKLVELLKADNILYEGDVKTEIEITGLDIDEASKLIKKLLDLDFKIVSYRGNDLQGAYESLAQEANEANKGKQTLKGQSTIKRNNEKNGGIEKSGETTSDASKNSSRNKIKSLFQKKRRG